MLQWFNHILEGTTKDSVGIGEAVWGPISSELSPTSAIGSLGKLIGIGAGKGTSNPTHQNQDQHDSIWWEQLRSCNKWNYLFPTSMSLFILITFSHAPWSSQSVWPTWRGDQGALSSQKVDLFIVMEEPNVVLAQHICCTGGCMREIEGNLKFLPFPILDYLFEQGKYAQFYP